MLLFYNTTSMRTSALQGNAYLQEAYFSANPRCPFASTLHACPNSQDTLQVVNNSGIYKAIVLTFLRRLIECYSRRHKQ
ncbi:hypothetical protein BDZ91DRAFT_712822 [Kalaharituber pfeilii]|nr:hypothetical protein BDZ91DRAFT_712822 [Kalaharituber pfeilii]